MGTKVATGLVLAVLGLALILFRERVARHPFVQPRGTKPMNVLIVGALMLMMGAGLALNLIYPD